MISTPRLPRRSSRRNRQPVPDPAQSIKAQTPRIVPGRTAVHPAVRAIWAPPPSPGLVLFTFGYPVFIIAAAVGAYRISFGAAFQDSGDASNFAMRRMQLGTVIGSMPFPGAHPGFASVRFGRRSSGAIFLILELAMPFTRVMRVSSTSSLASPIFDIEYAVR
jgi:hypothetical protein